MDNREWFYYTNTSYDPLNMTRGPLLDQGPFRYKFTVFPVAGILYTG